MKEKKILTRVNKEIKCRVDLKESHTETVPPGDSSHIQSPNTYTIADAKKCLFKGL